MMTGRIQAIGISIYAEQTYTSSLLLPNMEGMFVTGYKYLPDPS